MKKEEEDRRRRRSKEGEEGAIGEVVDFANTEFEEEAAAALQRLQMACHLCCIEWCGGEEGAIWQGYGLHPEFEEEAAVTLLWMACHLRTVAWCGMEVCRNQLVQPGVFAKYHELIFKSQ